MISTRPATTGDLEAVVALTRANRSLLAELEPDYWRKSANADESHAAWIAIQLANSSLTKRVLERDATVIGYAVSAEHPSGFFFVDDVCLSSAAQWSVEGAVMLHAVAERPALMTAPHLDTPRINAAFEVGLLHTSSVHTVRFDDASRAHRASELIEPIAEQTDLEDPPPHVWLPAMTSDSITIVGDADGYAVVSPPLRVPPIYDPGGPPALVDRVVGNNRRRQVDRALAFSAQRGDVGVMLLVRSDDDELAAIADELGARQPVDVFEWPVS